MWLSNMKVYWQKRTDAVVFLSYHFLKKLKMS